MLTLTIEKIMKAVRYICDVAPAFVDILVNIKFVGKEGVDTFYCTPDWRVVFPVNPPADIVKDDDCVFCVWHEVLHLLFQHFDREGGRNKKVWRYATDAAINSWLRQFIIENKLPLFVPENVIFPEQFGLPQLKSAEYYYKALEQLGEDQLPDLPGSEQSQDQGSNDPDQNKGQSKGGDGSGQDQDQNQGQGSGQSGSDQNKDKGNNSPAQGSEDKGRGKDKTKDGHGHNKRHGRCCGGGVPAIGDDDGDSPRLSDVEKEVIIQSVAEKISSNKLKGHIQGQMKEFLDNALKGKKIDWKALLRRYLAAAAGGHSRRPTFSRPSRHYTSDPRLIRMAWVKASPTAVIIVDDSGSMESYLGWCLEEVEKIARERFNVVFARCSSQDAEFFKSYKELREKVGRLGGTDILPAVEQAWKELNPRPSVIVVLTDYEWSRYPTDWAGCPVIIVDPTGKARKRILPNRWVIVEPKGGKP